MAIDLSDASDDGLVLILLRVPIKDLIRKCTQVSPQWDRILSESFFWRKKIEYDGYVLEWPKLVCLSTRAFQWMALKHCFNRNFLNDIWDLAERSLTMDPRWDINLVIGEIFAQIEIPPFFLYGQPEIPPGYDKPIAACVSIGDQIFQKCIVIKLADEGLTDEIMDNFRPTIVVSEMVSNRRYHSWTRSVYALKCSLEVSHDPFIVTESRYEIINENQREKHNEIRDNNGRWVYAYNILHFKQWEAEGWHRMEHTFKGYPAGMRYFALRCLGYGSGEDAEGYGLKLADCSVKALLEIREECGIIDEKNMPIDTFWPKF